MRDRTIVMSGALYVVAVRRDLDGEPVLSIRRGDQEVSSGLEALSVLEALVLRDLLTKEKS